MNIPAELIKLSQWVLYREENQGGPKLAKVPYNPLNKRRASVTDPATWADYSHVMNGHAAGFSGPGIVLTKENEIIAGDLDNPFAEVVNGELIIKERGDPEAESIAASHLKIVEHLNTYTEWSPSGKGFRLFFFGSIPEGWRSRIGKVEFYDHERFLTITGNHVAGTPLTIEHRQSQFEDVARALGLDKGSANVVVQSRPETRTDEQIYSAIVSSRVSEPFLELWFGRYETLKIGDGSGSAADIALANYICHFTDNTVQAERIFRSSPHFAGRTKLHTRDDLVARLINKGFDKKLPAIDASQLQVNAQAIQEQAQPEEASPFPALSLPPGLMGWIAQYIYSAAPRPIPEVALAGAIGLMGGIAGRAFNVAGSGLNQYVVMIGRTGIGKDAMSNGISRLLGELETTIPAARTFQGPPIIASAPALYRIFDKEKSRSPSVVSIVPEFGEWLGIHSDSKADGTRKALMAGMMEIYGKSGQGFEAGAMVYSDSDKNMKMVKAPSFTLIGDTVAPSFYAACTEANIIKGLIPRMLILEYRGSRPALNVGAHHHRADAHGLSLMTNFVHQALSNNEKDTATQVGATHGAKRMLDDFNAYCDRMYDEDMDNEVTAAVWSRAYLKALKLAALVAVGVNWYEPNIIEENAEWAINLCKRDIDTLLQKHKSGELPTVEGGLTDARHRVIFRIFLTHISRPFKEFSGQLLKETTEDMHNHRVMRLSLLKNMVLKRQPFKGEHTNVREQSFKNALDEISDVLQTANIVQMCQGLRRPNLGADWNVPREETKLIHCLDIERLKTVIGDLK